MQAVADIARLLITQSWHLAILIVIVALASYALRNRSAHIRYLLWLIVLAKCLLPPLLTVPVAILPETPPAAMASQDRTPLPEGSSLSTTSPRPVAPADNKLIRSLPPVDTGDQINAHLTIYEWMGLMWGVGVAAYAAIILAQALWTYLWIRARKRDLPLDLKQDVDLIFSNVGTTTPPNVWLLEGRAQPFVWGILRGSIYLPASIAERENKEHLKDVLMHEASHTRRFDVAVNSLQIIAQGIFWFHPFVWWANHRTRIEREKCCDEMAIALLGAQAKDYSRAIIDVVVKEYESTHPMSALAIVGPAKSIEERIRAMMRPGRRFYRRPSAMAALTIIVLALITVPTTLVLTSRAETEASGQLDQASEGVANEEIQEATSPSPHQTTQALLEAVKKDDIEQVKLLIAEGADVNGRDPNSQTVLNYAVKTGNKDLVALLIDKGADVDAIGYWGNAPLHLAAYDDSKDMTELLIEKGADVDIRQGGSNITPLQFACQNHVTSIAELLIAKGADVNAKDESGYTPLYWALWNEHFDNVRLVVTHGADLNYVKWEDWPPFYYILSANDKELVELMVEKGSRAPAFHLAAFRGDLEKVKSIYAGGADIDERDQVNWTPLHWAASGGKKDIVEFLIENGADVNAAGISKHTPLHQAARYGSRELVALLLSKGANVNAGSEFGSDTPLHCASDAGRRAVVELLIANGAEIDVKNKQGQTPLFLASTNGHAETVGFLIAKGADINIRDSRSRSALMRAQGGEHSEIVALLRQHGAKQTLHDAVVGPGKLTMLKRLISEGCDINARDSQGRTPLFLAVRLGHKDMVEVLLNEGADVNIAPDIWTPLIVALRIGRREIAAMLIKKGADITAQDLVGLTAMGIAKTKGDTEIVELLNARARQLDPKTEIMTIFDYVQLGDTEKVRLLIAAGQDVNTKTKNGRVALHGAAWTGHREIGELLIQNGADVNIQDNGGKTPLLIACQQGKTEFVELLLANGADINVKNNGGKTPLDFARQRGHTEIVELLQEHGAK